MSALLRRLSQAQKAPNDIYGTFKPTIYLTCAAGITPFRIRGPVGNRKIEISLIGCVNSVLLQIFFITCFVLAMIHDTSLTGYFFDSSISVVGDLLNKMTGVIGMTMIYIHCLRRRNILIQLLENMHDIDKRLADLGIILDYWKSFQFAAIVILLMIGVNIAFFVGSLEILENMGITPSFVSFVSFFMPQVVVCVTVVMFCCFTHKIRNRFMIVNKVMKDLTEEYSGRYTSITKSNSNSTESLSIYATTSKRSSEIIDDAMQIHCALCDAAATANSYFSYQLLTIVAISFLIIVFDAYYLLEAVLGTPRREIHFNTTEFIAFFSCQMTLYILAVFAIVEAGSKTMIQSSKTAKYVHKLLNQTKDVDLKQKLSYFSLQLIHEKVCFTAAGLFNIDRTLYFTISGATTTYLIILLQFTKSSDQTSHNLHQNFTQN